MPRSGAKETEESSIVVWSGLEQPFQVSQYYCSVAKYPVDHKEKGALVIGRKKVCTPHFRHASCDIGIARATEVIVRCSEETSEG